ncbi:MAG: hypothetical protein FD180_4546 [Planctomycetota bacterium]|nr:MAG: hypothetical protein FD180_4546 [Planctomycetota bacterium]
MGRSPRDDSRLNLWRVCVTLVLASLAISGLCVGFCDNRQSLKTMSPFVPASPSHDTAAGPICKEFGLDLNSQLGLISGEAISDIAFLADGAHLWAAIVVGAERGGRETMTSSRLVLKCWNIEFGNEESSLLAIRGSRIEEPRLLRRGAAILLAAVVDSELKVFDGATGFHSSTLIGPKGKEWESPFLLFWLQAVRSSDDTAWVGALRIGGSKGDHFCFWRLTDAPSAATELVPDVICSCPADGFYASLSDLIVDQDGTTYAVIASKSVSAAHRTCYLMGPITKDSVAADYTEIDSEYPAVNGRSIPKTPHGRVYARSGLPVAVVKGDFVYFLWQSKWRRKNASLVTRVIRLRDKSGTPTRVLDPGTTARIREHAIWVEESGEVLAIWSAGDSTSEAKLHVATLKPDGTSNMRNEELIGPAQNSSANWTGGFPHLSRGEGSGLYWWIIESDARLMLRGADGRLKVTHPLLPRTR